MGPGAVHLNLTAAGEGVILGVDVEVGDLTHAITGGVLRNRGDVVDSDTSAVVGLIDEAVLGVDVLVVVDGLDSAWLRVRTG